MMNFRAIVRHIALFCGCALMILGATTQDAWAQSDDEDADPLSSTVTTEDDDHKYDQKERGPAVSNLPLNFFGRSGLVYTTSTHVNPAWSVEVGGFYQSESSNDPDFTRSVAAFNANIAFPANLELSLHVPYVQSDLAVDLQQTDFGTDERVFAQSSDSGMGSVETMLKLSVANQQLFLPSLAIGVGYIGATGDYDELNPDYGLGTVDSFGFKAMLAMGLEINDLFFTRYAFAILADGTAVFRDLGVDDRDKEEKHAEVHLGMIFPLHPRNFVTLIAEYEGILLGGSTNEEDRNGILGGLRINTQHLGLTGGVEKIFVEDSDFEDRTRFFLSLSYRYGEPKPYFP
ncbi:MAG: hypothetical protein H6683_01885 [Deltaproteobacteria bacterium]|nr:hypothetical protein [Deltaproteobacteria bacterium]MCB9478408.1 hypothetical protein [Deltaproteobacteria bacterium]